MSAAQKNAILAMIREKYPEYHPLVALADMAHQAGMEDRIRFQCHQTIAKYVEPELKSIEVKGTHKIDFGLLKVTVVKERTFDVDYTVDGNDLESPPVITEPTPLGLEHQGSEDEIVVEPEDTRAAVMALVR